jgi:diaphanous 1
MADDSLIVPIEIPAGSLQFVTITSTGVIQDLLDTVEGDKHILTQLIGDLPSYGFAIQRIRKEHNGRQWEEDELERLGNGKQ